MLEKQESPNLMLEKEESPNLKLEKEEGPNLKLDKEQSPNLKLDIWSCLRSILRRNISRLRTFSSLY
jgi:hypothetical protein